MRRILRNTFTSTTITPSRAVPRSFFEQEPEVSTPNKEVQEAKYLPSKIRDRFASKLACINNQLK